MSNLGFEYEQGINVTRDYSLAISWYQKAVAKKITRELMNNIGMLAMYGRGMTQAYNVAKILA